MSTRKYISEFGLNMVAGFRFLLQQDGLEKIDETGVDPHIYIIARRPIITLVPETVVFSDAEVKGEFNKQIKDKYISIPFCAPNFLGTSNVTLKCDYPYSEFQMLDETGASLSNGKCALLLATLGMQYWEHMDLEVLYIGQSYGKDGSRTASDRLKKHETLQGIYAEAIKNSPDQDIWMMLCTFETFLLGTFDGRQKEYTASFSEDTDHIREVVRADISEQQKINFTEAALIRYFQPEYNYTYKNNFPSPAHTTYSECYDIDLNMINVELQTEDLGYKLWSETVKPQWVHFCSFPLNSREERKYMFEFDGKDAL